MFDRSDRRQVEDGTAAARANGRKPCGLDPSSREASRGSDTRRTSQTLRCGEGTGGFSTMAAERDEAQLWDISVAAMSRYGTSQPRNGIQSADGFRSLSPACEAEGRGRLLEACSRVCG